MNKKMVLKRQDITSEEKRKEDQFEKDLSSWTVPDRIKVGNFKRINIFSI